MRFYILFLTLITINQKIYTQTFNWESMQLPSQEMVKLMAINSDGDLFVATDSLRILALLYGSGNWITISNSLPLDTMTGLSIGNDKTIYAAFKNTGVYRSTNKGVQWEIINGDFSKIKIQAIAVNEENWLFVGTNKGMYYLETGSNEWNHDSTDERDIYVIACDTGSRVYANYDFSYDNGKTWNFRGMMLAQPICIGVQGIHWYNGVVHGIYSSHWENYGAWGHTNDPVSGIPVYSILPLYDGGSAIAGTSNGLFYTKDWARTWENIGSQLPELLFTSVVMDSNGYIYVGSKNTISRSIKSVLKVIPKNSATIPLQYLLKQNYPNPFNPTTNISFSIPTQTFVSLKIFDLIGREVETIFSGEMRAGGYSKQWNAANYPSGIYLYRLQAGSFVETKKLILLK